MKADLSVRCRLAVLTLWAISGIVTAAPMAMTVGEGAAGAKEASVNPSALTGAIRGTSTADGDVAPPPPPNTVPQAASVVNTGVEVTKSLGDAAKEAGSLRLGGLAVEGTQISKGVGVTGTVVNATIAGAAAVDCVNTAASSIPPAGSAARPCGHATGAVAEAGGDIAIALGKIPKSAAPLFTAGAAAVKAGFGAYDLAAQGKPVEAIRAGIQDGEPVATACQVALQAAATMGVACLPVLAPVAPVLVMGAGLIGRNIGGYGDEYLAQNAETIYAGYNSLQDDFDSLTQDAEAESDAFSQDINKRFDQIQIRNQEVAEQRRQEAEHAPLLAPSGESDFTRELTAALASYSELQEATPSPGATGPCHAGHDEAAHPGGCLQGR